MFTTKYMKSQPKKPTQKFSRGGRVAGRHYNDDAEGKDVGPYYDEETDTNDFPPPDQPRRASEDGLTSQVKPVWLSYKKMQGKN